MIVRRICAYRFEHVPDLNDTGQSRLRSLDGIFAAHRPKPNCPVRTHGSCEPKLARRPHSERVRDSHAFAIDLHRAARPTASAVSFQGCEFEAKKQELLGPHLAASRRTLNGIRNSLGIAEFSHENNLRAGAAFIWPSLLRRSAAAVEVRPRSRSRSPRSTNRAHTRRRPQHRPRMRSP